MTRMKKIELSFVEGPVLFFFNSFTRLLLVIVSFFVLYILSLTVQWFSLSRLAEISE